MKTLGVILTIIGLILTIIFAIQVGQNSGSANILGLKIGVSAANWTPLIISGLVFLAGIIIWVTAANTAKR